MSVKRSSYIEVPLVAFLFAVLLVTFYSSGYLSKIHPLNFTVFALFTIKSVFNFFIEDIHESDTLPGKMWSPIVWSILLWGYFRVTIPIAFATFKYLVGGTIIEGSILFREPVILLNFVIYSPLIVGHFFLRIFRNNDNISAEEKTKNDIGITSNRDRIQQSSSKPSSKKVNQGNHSYIIPEERENLKEDGNQENISFLIPKEEQSNKEESKMLGVNEEERRIIKEAADRIRFQLLSFDPKVRMPIIMLNSFHTLKMLQTINAVDISPLDRIEEVHADIFKYLFGLDLNELIEYRKKNVSDKGFEELFDKFCYSIKFIINADENLENESVADFSKILNYTFCLYLANYYNFTYIKPLRQLCSLFVSDFDEDYINSTYDQYIRLFEIILKIPLSNYKSAIASLNEEESKKLISIHLQLLREDSKATYETLLAEILTQYEQKFLGDLSVELDNCESINEYIEVFGRLDVNENYSSEIKDSLSEAKEEYLTGLHELERMIGLSNIKVNIKETIAYIKVSSARGSKQNLNLNCCFLGAPGTGKTVVARIYGKILSEIGALESGHLVETDRSGLVGGYIGQTAIKTKEMCEKALNGVLFVDEAYTLFRKDKSDDTFGLEAIDTILKFMEDNKGKIAVIFAGYENEMHTFLSSNPGLKSRVSNFFSFPNYSKDELIQIAKIFLDDHKVNYDQATIDKIVTKVYEDNQLPGYANARTLRNVIEKTLRRQSLRVFELLETLGQENNSEVHTIKIEDVA